MGSKRDLGDPGGLNDSALNRVRLGNLSCRRVDDYLIVGTQFETNLTVGLLVCITAVTMG